MASIQASQTTPRNWALRGLLLIALVFAVREARPLLAPVLIAVLLTLALAPAVRWLRRRGVPEMLGALVIVVALLGSTVPLAMSLARPAAAWWEAAPTTAAQLLDRLDKLRATIPGMRPPTRAGRSTVTAPDPLREKLATEGFALTGIVLTRSLALAVSATATVILLYFLLASEHWVLRRIVEAVPRQRTRALLLGGLRTAQREIAHWLAVVGVVNGTVGCIMGLTLWALGLPNPIMWGVLTAVFCFVPYIGPMALAALLLLAGISAFDSASQILAPMLAFAVIHGVESNIVSPLIVGRRLMLSPVAVFLSVMFWGWLWGIPGALIAVPVLIALRSVSRRMRGLRLLRCFLEGDRREAPPSLRMLLRRPVKPAPPSRKRYT
ncbi:AI-2E family transporter [Roseateles asaccharophilus]|uniref:PurR-regulated permease PerM n=1 Tax=Roseateles asaccharophilus TaxID=582607 RepID=A0ABU2A256_9BURK|nr:AI-2E family transporter [Roseateles asaccharophilus]MDR7331279.1 putative PurR-regulated permease PerM [Roseateles asaccharophilus]